MADYNITSKNLTLGAGELRFARFLPGGFTHKGYRLIGNCPQFSLSRNSELLTHRSSLGGVRRKDKEIDLDPSWKGAIKTDDISFQNMAIWLGSYIEGISATSLTAKAYVLKTYKDTWHQLGQTTTDIDGDRKVSNVVVTRASPSTTYVEGTDYYIDAPNGLIYIPDGSSIPAGEDITVTYNRAATTRRVIVPTADPVEGELLFISRNQIGTNFTMRFPRVSMKPAGEMSMITDGAFMDITWDVSTLERPGHKPFRLETRSAAS